jgi:6-phosphogluconolactonase/glucosamine-6-phosphate isomerase/deaminase
MSRLEVLPAAGWADRVSGQLIERIRDQPDLRLCLPTGDTPSPVFERLVAASRRGDVSFAGVTIVALDEFVGLQPWDPARCDQRLRREFLDGLADPPRAVHLVDVADPDPTAAAARHDAIAAGGLDLVLLGLGMNGHVGLNEPGSSADSPTRVVETAASSRAAAMDRYGAAAPPTLGITLGMDRLLAAGEVWLLVTGARKAEILDRTLHDPEGPEVPATFLRRHPRLTVFADEPAAGSVGSGGG